jgi:hypothetical protein
MRIEEFLCYKGIMKKSARKTIAKIRTIFKLILMSRRRIHIYLTSSDERKIRLRKI